jgi:hypothetical protein
MSQLDFDIFELHALTHGHPLSFIAHACMQVCLYTSSMYMLVYHPSSLMRYWGLFFIEI